jgi:hypothetical protein
VEKAAASLKQMRTMHIVFIVALALYAYTSELVAGRNGSQISTAFLYGMTIFAGFDALIAMYFRRAKLMPALETLRRDPNDAEALRQWRFATLVSMLLALSIGLYGFAVRFMGAPKPVSWLFYVAALILLLAWRPKLEVPVELPGASANQ